MTRVDNDGTWVRYKYILLTIPLTGLRSNSPHKGSLNPSVSRIRHHPRRGLYLLTHSFHMWISRRHIGSGKSRKDWDRSPILLQTFGKWTDPGWSCVSSIKTKSQLMRKWIILMLNSCTTCWLPQISNLLNMTTTPNWDWNKKLVREGLNTTFF